MKNLKDCNSCIGKSTTSDCLNCTNNKLKNGINNIKEFVSEIDNKMNKMPNYIFYFNVLYYQEISKLVNLSLIPQNRIIVTSALPDDELGIIVDVDKIDWGNIYI